MTNIESRVTRVCTFTPVAFGHLKTFQLGFQLQADELEPGRTVTNSETLGRIIHAYAQMGLVAARMEMSIPALCSALWEGDLLITRPSPEALI